MKKNISAKKATVAEQPKYQTYFAIVIAAAFAILPFVTYLKVDTLTGNSARFFYNEEGLSVDLFLYYKEIFLLICAIFAILFFFGERIFPENPVRHSPLTDKRKRLPVILIGAYALLAILSALFSQNKEVVLMGTPHEYEGLAALLSYVVLFLTGLNYFSAEKPLKLLRIASTALVCAVCVLGLVEYLYKPLLEIPFLRSVSAPSEYSEYMKSLKTGFFSNMIALTFYNPNYLGGFCTLFFPAMIGATFSSKGILRIISAVGSVFLLFVLVASRSTAALYIVLLSAVIMIIIFRRAILTNIKWVGAYACLIAAVFAGINILSSGQLTDALGRSLLNKKSSDTTDTSTIEKFSLTDIKSEGEKLWIVGKTDSLLVTVPKASSAASEQLVFEDTGGNKLLTNIDSSDIVSFSDERYKNIRLQVQENRLAIELGYDSPLSFYITEDGIKGVGQNLIPIDKFSYPRTPFFEKFYGTATGRGYAWIKTIEMLPASAVLGKGPDNFALYFPHNDYVGLLNTHGSTDLMIDKPHNMYLQTAINTGIPSLLIILALLAIVFFKGFRFIINPKAAEAYEDIFFFKSGMLIGVFAFALSGLTNDSMLCTSPQFWLILGCCSGVFIR